MSETPEQPARVQSDAQLSAADWTVQDTATLNLFTSRGVAVGVARDMANLDIFWLKDDRLEDGENSPPPPPRTRRLNCRKLEAAVEEALASKED